MQSFPPEKVVDNFTGIVRWISEIPIDPGEPEIFNYSVKMCDSGKYLPVGCYDRNGGAGLTREQAYRAALGEAVERYCCSVYFRDELLFGPAKEVSRHARLFGPPDMALFHEQQRGTIRYPEYTEELPISWTRAYSLTKREPVLVPASMTFIPYYPFFQQGGEQNVGPGITTGQASAFNYMEAALRGVYEIVERDAFMITWSARLTVPRINIGSSPKLAKTFEERFSRPNLRYSFHSLATDTGIPSILCIVVDDDRDPPMICTGGASHADAEKAALKALVEAVQTREWAKYMGRRREPFVFESDYSNMDDFDKHVLLYAYGNMEPSIEFLTGSPSEMSFSDFEQPQFSSAKDEFCHVRGRVEGLGYEVVLTDLTTCDVRQCGYRAVKMFISQMQQLEGEYSHRMLGGRRLYEVPGKLGYSVRPAFETLNPDPHPYP